MPQPFANRIGIVASALSSDAREATRVARVMGIGGLLFHAVSTSLDLTALSASGQREFRNVVSSQQRTILGLRCDVGPKGFAPDADVERELHGLNRAMETAAGLQSSLVCVDVGPLPRPPVEAAPVKPQVTQDMAGLILLPDGMSGAKPQAGESSARSEPRRPVDEAFESQLDAVLVELGKSADRFGVMLALRSELASLAALERALQRAACPWFGVDLDPVSVLRDEWPLDETFSRLGAHIRHVRARDATAGSGQRTSPAVLGRGSLNWKEFLANLDDAGYSGWLTIDPIDLPDRQLAVASALKMFGATAGSD